MPEPRDAGHWSKPVDKLAVGDVPAEAININVEGRRLTGPIQGFGRLWQRTYRVTVPTDTISARELMAEWKAGFGGFWPKGNRFYGPLTSLGPGDVALLNLRTGTGVKMSTGVFVVYADDESFTFMNAEGHQFAGFITFSASDEDSGTVVQVSAQVRASDPIYEIGMPIMRRIEDRFWFATLGNIAARFGAAGAKVELVRVCVDRRRQWRQWRNLRHNSLLTSALYPFGGRRRARRRRSADG